MKKMKKIFLAILIIILIAVAVIFAVSSKKDETEETTTASTTVMETTTIEEKTTEIETTEVTTGEVTSVENTTEKETQNYENLMLFKEIKVLSSELPFVVSGVDGIETVKLHIPRQSEEEEDAFKTTYIDIECVGESENIAIKFDPANGINTGNIVAKEEMLHSNLTYFYINRRYTYDYRYTQNYTFKRDGEMLIFTDFPENIGEIRISNRSEFPIFEGKIDGEDVVVSDIIIRFN